MIEQAAAVHDLGKIGVPDRVLLKPGPLSAAEQDLMREHSHLGSVILTRFELFRPGAEIVRHHHERWDGAGFPDGLAGEAIPLGARVVAVVDAFDAMTSDRPYRAALSETEAVRRLAAGAGSQWDPRITAAFLELMAPGAAPQGPPDPPPAVRSPAASRGRCRVGRSRTSRRRRCDGRAAGGRARPRQSPLRVAVVEPDGVGLRQPGHARRGSAPGGNHARCVGIRDGSARVRGDAALSRLLDPGGSARRSGRPAGPADGHEPGTCRHPDEHPCGRIARHDVAARAVRRRLRARRTECLFGRRTPELRAGAARAR